MDALFRTPVPFLDQLWHGFPRLWTAHLLILSQLNCAATLQRRASSTASLSTCRCRSLTSQPKVTVKQQQDMSPKLQADVQRLCSILRRQPFRSDSLSVAVDCLTRQHVVEVLQNLRRKANVALFFFQWSGQQKNYNHDSDTYNAILSIMGPAKQFHALDMLLAEMRSKNCKINSRTFGLLISCYGKAGMIEEAINVFSDIRHAYPEAHTRTYNTLLSCLTKAKYIGMALMLYRRMAYADCLPNTFTLNILVTGLCKAKRVVEGFQVFEELVGKGIRPDIFTYNALIEGHCDADNPMLAGNLFLLMQERGHNPDFMTYKVLIRGLCKAGRVDEAICAIEDAFNHGCFPGESSIITIVTAACKAGKSREALNMFKKALLQKHISWRVDICNTLISGFFQEGKVDKALHFFYEMSEIGCFPNRATHSILFGGLDQAGRVNEVLQLKEVMASDSKLLGCSSLTLESEVEKIARGWGVECNTAFFNNLIVRFCKLGKLEEAFKVLHTMILVSCCEPNSVVYNGLIKALCFTGRLDESCRLLEKIYENGLKSDILTYTTLIDTSAKLGELLHAQFFLKRMLLDGIAPDVYVYSPIVNGLCKAGKLRAAYRMLDHMDKVGCIANGFTYGPMFQLLCETRDLNKACELLKLMKQKSKTPSNLTLKMLATTFFKKEELKRLACLEPRILRVYHDLYQLQVTC